MTDQVPNFTLPSQEASLNSSTSTSSFFRSALKITTRVVPPIAAVALVVWIARTLLQRAQQKQIRDFQTQLASFSSMLDLDKNEKTADGAGLKSSVQNAKDSADMARQMLETTGRKYKFRAEGEKMEKKEENIETKVRLDLFKAGSASQKRQEDVSKKVDDVLPDNAYEIAIADGLKNMEDGADVDAQIEKLNEIREKEGLQKEEAVSIFEKYVSKVVSAQIDKAAVHLDSDDRESLQNLNILAVIMASAKGLGGDAKLEYVGTNAGSGKVMEELYRRYAVFCLSSEERVRNDLQSLVDMQTLLKVDDARAETINTEIAKGMFQVAVSAAMADGSLDQGSRDALEKLKESFGDLLDGGSADSIMSEVAVMRAMYSLQQLLQEQGVSDDDVKELRKMCSELGVDIDEMLQNADALGDALGPEAKEFVDSLRGLLISSGATGDTIVTSATPVEPTKDSSPTPEAP